MKSRAVFCGLCLLAILGLNPAGGEDRGLKIRGVLGDDLQLPEYHALVIGINQYKHWRSLRQAREDAQNVAALLDSRYGFKSVMTLYDEQATREGIVNALRTLTRTLTPNDSLLIYFAGHGFYDQLLKKGYWIPVEGRERIDEEPAINDWMPNSNLKEYTDAMLARHVLVVSDSCFSGAMLRGGRVDIETRENTWYRRAISQPTRWCVASGDLETVPDQSIFAQKFLQVLQYPRQTVFAASDLAGWIKNDVAAYSGRRPVFGPMNTASGSDLGEFIFLVHEPAAPTAPVATLAPAPNPEPPRAELVAPNSLLPEVATRQVARFGGLEVESPIAASVQINGGTGYPVAAGKALRWDKMPVGTYQIELTAGVRTWSATARVFEGSKCSVKAFPEELELQQALAKARTDAAARAEREAVAEADARATKALLDQQLKQPADFWATQKKSEVPEAETKKHRPRAH